MKKILLIAAVIFCMVQGNALASTSTGVITQLISYVSDNYSYIIFTTGQTNTSCGGGYYAVRSDNPSFKLMSATILTAFSMGKSINVYGNNACTNISIREEVSMVQMNNP